MVQLFSVLDILPQREPFILIDAMLHYDDNKTTTSFEIKDCSLFLSGDRLTTTGVIENIAQTCAARIGYINKFILKRDISAGFVAAIKKLEICQWPHIGDVITTDIEVQAEVFDMMRAMAIVRLGGKEIATAECRMHNS